MSLTKLFLFTICFKLFVFSVLFLLIHQQILILLKLNPTYTPEIHLIFAITNFFLILLFYFIAQKWYDKAGLSFMSFFIIKAVLILTFFMVKSKTTNISNSLILNFFLVFLGHQIHSIFICYQVLVHFHKNS